MSEAIRCSACGAAATAAGGPCPACLLAATADLAAAARPAANSLLPYLRILTVVGESAHARVYLAGWVPPASGFAAVKRLHRPVAPRFLDEAGAHRVLGLDHPHVATLFDSGVDADGRPYCVTEFVPGTPLVPWCRHRLPPVRTRLELLLQLAETLEFVQSRGMAHRNLKPGNVLVDRAAGIKVLDFGAVLPITGEAAASDLERLCAMVAQVLREPAPPGSATEPLDDLQRVSRTASSSAPDRYGSLREVSADLARLIGTRT